MLCCAALRFKPYINCSPLLNKLLPNVTITGHGRCILSKNYSLQFLLIEFFLQGLSKQNNRLCDMAYLCACTYKVWDVAIFPFPV